MREEQILRETDIEILRETHTKTEQVCKRWPKYTPSTCGVQASAQGVRDKDNL